MRLGVPVDNVIETIKDRSSWARVKTKADGDIRQTYYGKKAAVTISVRDIENHSN